MSGFGERFRKAGYSVPKPLIEIDGKPIIAHVIDMFPGEENFIFICNQDHLDHADYAMRAILERYCPTGIIIGIPPHKLGPVHAVQQVEHLIHPDQPVIVNYCDFTCYWDWQHFKQFVRRAKCAGAIPAYKGFHPHSLGSTNYAYLKEEKGWVSDIQEKQPYTQNRMEEFASSGTYYFASGRLMSHAFQQVVERNLALGGEYYVSLAYKPLLEEHQPICVYPLQHFMQWGTPEDVAEYKSWSSTFKRLLEPEEKPVPRGAVVIPMAGLGQRFMKEGYTLTKPLIPVSGKPMVLQAVHDLPPARHHVFVLRNDMPGLQEIQHAIRENYPEVVLESVAAVTEGQACTALIGLAALEKNCHDKISPITFGACDNGALYDALALQALMDDPKVDIIVWGVRGHPNAARHPQMFGWIDEKEGAIHRISVKTPLANPAFDPIVLGCFTFKRAQDFHRVVEQLIERNGRINGEFYIDSCINDALALGLSCHLFEVDHFLSFGTPNDLRTFEYWQSCFHKWDSHPYALQLDGRVASDALSILEERYQQLIPPFLEVAV